MKNIEFKSFLFLFAVFSKSLTQHFVYSLTNQDAEACGPTEMNEGLEILANDTSQMLFIVNNTAPLVGMIIDAKDHDYALWNGTSGDTIIIDIPSQSGTLLSQSNSPMLYNVNTNSVEDWLKTVPSLKSLELLSGGGRQFKLSNIPPDIMEMMVSILKRLSGCVPVTNSSISQITALVDKLSTELTGPLNGILSEVHGRMPVPGNLMQLFGMLSALDQIFARAQGGLKSVQNSGVNLNLQDLLKSANAVDLLTNLLHQIGAVVNPSLILAPVFATVASLLALVAAIGDALFAIVGGVLNLVIAIVAGVLGLVIGLVTAVLGLGEAVAVLGISILDLPIQLINLISKLLSPSLLQELLSSLENLFKTVASFKPNMPGMDKAISSLQGVSNKGTDSSLIDINYSNNRIDNNYSLLNFKF